MSPRKEWGFVHAYPANKSILIRKKGKNEHSFAHFFLFLSIIQYILGNSKIKYMLFSLANTKLWTQSQIIRDHFYVNLGVYSI